MTLRCDLRTRRRDLDARVAVFSRDLGSNTADPLLRPRVSSLPKNSPTLLYLLSFLSSLSSRLVQFCKCLEQSPLLLFAEISILIPQRCQVSHYKLQYIFFCFSYRLPSRSVLRQLLKFTVSAIFSYCRLSVHVLLSKRGHTRT